MLSNDFPNLSFTHSKNCTPSMLSITNCKAMVLEIGAVVLRAQ
jgi:hypothetical protein